MGKTKTPRTPLPSRASRHTMPAFDNNSGTVHMPSPLFRRPRVVLPAAALTLLTACSTLEQQKSYQKRRDETVKTTGTVTAATSAAVKRMQDYLARKDVLEKFHDSAEHSEDAVLGVLRKAGIGPARPQPPAGKPAPAKPA